MHIDGHVESCHVYWSVAGQARPLRMIMDSVKRIILVYNPHHLFIPDSLESTKFLVPTQTSFKGTSWSHEDFQGIAIRPHLIFAGAADHTT